MINVKDLKEKLKNIPNTAIIYTESEHGQSPNKAGRIFVTDDIELPYNGDEINWYEEVDYPKKITAVLICQ